MQKNINRVAQKVMSAQLAGRGSDPAFYGGLAVLPNPDPILRQHGYASDTFDAIEADPHVMGELRSVRGNMLSYDRRVVDGVEGKAEGKDKAAWELCQEFMKQQPADNMTWADTCWNMAKAVFHGQAIHELVWENSGGVLLPQQVLDVPNRRFVYNNDNQLRL